MKGYFKSAASWLNSVWAGARGEPAEQKAAPRPEIINRPKKDR